MISYVQDNFCEVDSNSQACILKTVKHGTSKATRSKLYSEYGIIALDLLLEKQPIARLTKAELAKYITAKPLGVQYHELTGYVTNFVLKSKKHELD